jgi:hypothetical protein
MRYGMIALATAVSACAQTGLPKEVIELARIKYHMKQMLSRMPDYTCFETVYRSGRTRNKPLRLIDALRLQVGYVGGKEVYAWPNETQFGGAALGEIVGAGTLSTGEFTMHARAIFVNDNAVTKYAGAERLRGHDALKYDFRISTFRSGWILNFDGDKATVGSEGSFWADAHSFDLLRLDFHAIEIPALFPLSGARIQIDYGRAQIGGSGMVLPESSNLWMTRLDGSESRNRVEFSQCRSYRAEATLHFNGEPGFDPSKASAAAAPAPPVEDVILPPNLQLPIALDAAIDSEKAREGDVVMAHVRSDVKLKGEVTVPKGAVVAGRIRRLESYTDPKPHTIVGIEFTEVEFDRKRALFLGALQYVDPFPGLSRALTIGPGRHGAAPDIPQLDRGPDGMIVPSLPATINNERTETLTTEDLPGVGTFFIDGNRFVLPAGLRMTWRTEVYKK